MDVLEQTQTIVVNPLRPLYNLVATHEDWLMNRVLGYAKKQGYTAYTSTLAEAWRVSVCGLSTPLLEAIEHSPEIPELEPDADYRADPIASFGILEAQRHRTRGVTLGLFLGLMKYYRQSYIDLVGEGNFSLDQQQYFCLYIQRFFDRVELGFCVEWTQLSETDKLVELQHKNRYLTNEKNKYLTIFESLKNPAFLFDKTGKLINLNHSAVVYFKGVNIPGLIYYGQGKLSMEIPWLEKRVRRFIDSQKMEDSFEFCAQTNLGQRCFDVNLKQMLDVSDKFSGTVVVCNDITERKAEEEKLRISQANLAQAQHIGHIGNWCWNISTGEINWSDEVYYILGQTKKNFQPTHEKFLKLVHPEDISEVKEGEAIAVQQGKRYAVSHRVILPDGEVRWVHQEAVPTLDEQGHTLSLVGTIQDITEQKKTEESLQIKQFAIACALSGIVIGDLEGNLTYVNKMFLQMWGYEDEYEVIGKHFLSFWQIPKRAKEVVASVQLKRQWMGELVARRKNGTLFDAQVSANLVTNGKNQSICMMVSIMDITEQKSTAKSLEKILKIYTNLTQLVPVGIVRTDAKGNCIYGNERACKIVGITLEEFLENGWLNHIHIEERERVLQQWGQCLQKREPFRNEYRYPDSNGTFVWVLAQAIPEVDEQGKLLGYVGTLTDITERKKAEEEITRIHGEMQAIFDTFPDLLFRINREGKILDYRTKYHSLLSANRFQENCIQDFLPDVIGKKIYNAVQKSIKINDAVSLEYSFPSLEGEEFFEARLIPFNNNETIAIIRNITDRKKAEIALRESEERLKTIIMTNPNGLMVIDDQGQVLFVNPAAEELFGRKTEELLGEVLGIPIIGSGFDELEIPQKNGKLIITRIKLVEINWEGKKAYIASLTDITDLKQAKEQLQILHRAIEHSPVSIVITDVDGNIQYVNPKFERVTGYCRQEVMGKNPRVLKSGVTPAEEYKQLWDTILSGKEWHGEFHNCRKDGGLFWEAASISPIKNAEDVITHFVAVKEDITEKKAQEAALSYQANYDALTGLPNRFLAMDRLKQSLMQGDRNSKRVAIMFVDLDHFKNVNDTLGHEYGDLLLIQTAKRIQDCLRKSDTVARLGGDEFLIIISDLEHPSQCKQIAAKILAVLAQPFDLSGEEAFISASIGITIYPDDGTDISVLMRNADAAMYQGKRGGRNDFRFYTIGLNEEAQKRVRLENCLRRAVEKNEIYPLYQPFIALESGAVVGAEALIRWRNPEFGKVSPDVFIPIAEETGLINEIGAWMLSTASQEVGYWQKQGYALWVAVNLSPRQFRDENFLQVINSAINRAGISPEKLELEITEKLLLEDVPGASELLHQLARMNFRLSIDDFGTGYSSLSYLVKFPFSVLKIDRSFIADVPNNQEFVALVKTMIAMAHGLNLKVVAEGIETQEQMEFLRSQGCDYGQGYLFSRPLTANQFRGYLSTSKIEIE